MSQNDDQLMNGFPVDDCFGNGIGRGPLDSLAWGRVDGPAEMVTFEEFIRGKRRQQQIGDCLNLRPIDEYAPNDDDGFFDTGLDLTGKEIPPEDPLNNSIGKKANKMMASTKGGGRSKLYAVEGGCQSTEPRMALMSLSGASFHQSFCPTVGEGGHWLGVGGPRRGSQDSAAYGFDLHPETKSKNSVENDKMRRIGSQQQYCDGICSSSSANRFDATIQNGGHQLAANNSRAQPHNLLLSKFFCCFRTVEGNGESGIFRSNNGQTVDDTQEERPKVYSWDLRQSTGLDASEFLWRGIEEKMLVKEPGQLAGNGFQIEGCSSATITIDDCRNCLILCGPCKGSIFLRNCTNLLVLAVCQQFRTRDCRQLTAHLFCATSPTIEETQIEVAPLLLAYSGLQSQMFAAGLSPFANRWNKIHNFTPDTGKCQILQNVHPIANSSTNGQLIHRLKQFLYGSQIVEMFQLKLGGTFGDSQLFFDATGQQKSNQFVDYKEDERILVLLQPLKDANMRFYSESVEIVRELLTTSGNVPTIMNKLLAMHDIDLKQGEWELLMDSRKGAKQQQAPSSIKKIVAIEVGGQRGLAQNAEWVCRQERKATIAELMDREQMENQRKQLYRLCEIRQSI